MSILSLTLWYYIKEVIISQIFENKSNDIISLETKKKVFDKKDIIEKLKELSEYELRSVSQLINCILRRYFDNINQDN